MKSILNIKSVGFNYEILEEYVAGLVLDGWMVKAIREGKISCADGSYVSINSKGEAYIDGVNIKASEKVMKGIGLKEVNERPSIKLLLNKKEISRMIGLQKEKGYTIVLKSLFWKGHLVKANIAVAKGKKLYDKRQDIKDKDVKRDLDRVMKQVKRT